MTPPTASCPSLPPAIQPVRLFPRAPTDTAYASTAVIINARAPRAAARRAALERARECPWFPPRPADAAAPERAGLWEKSSWRVRTGTTRRAGCARLRTCRCAVRACDAGRFEGGGWDGLTVECEVGAALEWLHQDHATSGRSRGGVVHA